MYTRTKRSSKREILSIFITLIVIGVLITAGPVEAVKLSVKSDKQVYTPGDTEVILYVNVNIQKNEVIPLQKMRLSINNEFKVCEFTLSGTNSCSNIEIILLNPGDLALAQRNAKGFGYKEGENPHTQKLDFGFGYGYEEETNLPFDAELRYKIIWKVVADAVPDGKYSAIIEASASNGQKSFTFVSTAPEAFHINFIPAQYPKNLEEAEVKGDHGNVQMIDGLTQFRNQNIKFTGNLRKANADGRVQAFGAAILSLYAEKDDSTKVDVQLKIDDYKLNSFTSSLIDLEGVASVQYKKTKIGIWENGKRTGTEPSKFMIDKIKVHVYIQPDKIMIFSDDPKLSFNMEIPVSYSRYR